MTTLGAGTYNTILGENRDAFNDALLAAQKHLDDYHLEQKQQEQIEQGENQKTGAMDAGAATGGVSNLARFAVRKAQTGKSFAQMAVEDFRNLKGKTPSAPAESFNTIATSEGTVDKATGELTRGTEGGVEVPESNATEGGAATGTPTEAAAETTEDAASAVERGAGEAAEVAAEGAGRIGGQVAGDAAKAMAKTIAAKTAFWGGKALGNVGGAIDLVKDIKTAAEGGNFFAGDGSSTLDEVSNGLTLAGSALDIAGIALPFLEPIGLALTTAGAIGETAGSLQDEDDQEKANKEDFTNNQPPAAVPRGAAGLGFVASAPTNPMKMITGSSSF